MKFDPPLAPATLIRRYKRFLADIAWPDGRIETVHCPNTGAMLGCDRPDSPVWLSRSGNPKRKYAWSWELVEAEPGVLVGIHTGRTNALVREALDSGCLSGLEGVRVVRGEFTPPGADSRFDLLGRDMAGRDVLVEVKNVTAAVGDGIGFFPDAVSTRASRHVRELARLAGEGWRVVLCYCVQRGDVRAVRPAAEIDPAYAESMAFAVEGGLEVVAAGCAVTPESVSIARRLSFSLS